MHQLKIFFVAFLFVSLFVPQFSRAFSISPLRYEMTIGQGSFQEARVTVKNDEAVRLWFSMAALQGRRDEEGRVSFVKENSVQQLAIPDINNFSLNPKEEKVVTFKIVVPADYALAEYLLGLASEARASEEAQALAGQLIVPVKVRVVAKEEIVSAPATGRSGAWKWGVGGAALAALVAAGIVGKRKKLF